jgi:hypothetical protein
MLLQKDKFFKTVSIPMGTNCAPFLADLFHYSYEADFIQGFFKKTEKKASLIFQFHGHCVVCLSVHMRVLLELLLHINGKFIMGKWKSSLLPQRFVLNGISVSQRTIDMFHLL